MYICLAAVVRFEIIEIGRRHRLSPAGRRKRGNDFSEAYKRGRIKQQQI